MASHRHGSGKKKGKKKGRGRKSAGKRLARFNALRRGGMTKAEAREAVFGHGGPRSHRKGRKGRKGRKHASHGRSHRAGGYYRRSNFGAVLRDIQREEGTTGFPPTDAERQMAYDVIAHMGGMPSAMTEEQKLKARFEADKRALVKRRAAQLIRQKKIEEERDLEREAERLAASEISRAL